MGQPVGSGAYRRSAGVAHPLRLAITATIADRTRAQTLLVGENRLLERILDELCRLVEEGAVLVVKCTVDRLLHESPKQAEDRIRQNEGEFRQIVEAIPAFILVLSAEGNAYA